MGREEKMELNNFIGRCSNDNHIERKGDGIYLETFAYKGCWNCPWFIWDNPEVKTVEQIAEEKKVSRATVRRWCREGKLEAELCEQERFGDGRDSGKLWMDGSCKLWIIKTKE